MNPFTVLIILYLSWPWSVSAICPQACSCPLDSRGRTTVSCSQGGMIGSIPLTDLSLDVEVINVTAPETNTNALTMGPIFDDFESLEELHITRSNIPELGKYFFHKLKKLEVLNLSQNNITQPLKYNFYGLDNLKKLILDDNSIESLTSESFTYLRKLSVLSIRRNKIQSMMPRIFYHLGKLRVLKLSGNPLGSLNPDVFKDIQELQELECRSCALQTINYEVFQHLQQLVLLDLSHNEIERIFANDFVYMKNLKHLKLTGNKLFSISNNALIHLVNLEKLNLAKNYIAHIDPDAFSRVYHLKALDIGYNKLEEMNVSVLKDLGERVESLILSGNALSIFFVKALNNASNLRELHLADMGITDVPPGLLPPNLKTLNLAGNHLFYFRPEALPSGISTLDLSRNRFQGLDEEEVRRVEDIPHLKLHDNPWSCDLCNIIPLLERANKSKVIRKLRCSEPTNCRGKTLGAISKSDLGWCLTRGFRQSEANGIFLQDAKIGIIAAGVSVLLLALTAGAIIVALCYSKRHTAKYYTHEEKRAAESEAIFDNQMSLFGEEKEISFKFPMDYGEKKVAIATIDEEIKKEKMISNGL